MWSYIGDLLGFELRLFTTFCSLLLVLTEITVRFLPECAYKPLNPDKPLRTVTFLINDGLFHVLHSFGRMGRILGDLPLFLTVIPSYSQLKR